MEQRADVDRILGAAFVVAGNGREAAGGLLFEDSVDPVTACLNREDQSFRFAVTLQRDGEIDVAGEPWLRPCGNCQTTNQGPWLPQLS